MRRYYFQIPIGVAAVTLAAGLSGCSSGKNIANELAAMNGSNIQRLSNLYAAFQNYNSGRGPNDEAEFKKFVSDFDAEKLKMMGVDKNGVFTSERDRKPFKIRYKAGGGRGAVVAVVFEQEGSGGLKQVGYTGGKVDDVDDSTYRTLWAGNGDSAPPSSPPTGAPGSGGRPTGPPPGAPTGPSGK
jgi:hypothetical protein